MNRDFNEKINKFYLFTSQDELLHVGWKDEGFVSDVNDDVFDDCRWGFGGADYKKWKIMSNKSCFISLFTASITWGNSWKISLLTHLSKIVCANFWSKLFELIDEFDAVKLYWTQRIQNRQKNGYENNLLNEIVGNLFEELLLFVELINFVNLVHVLYLF